MPNKYEFYLLNIDIDIDIAIFCKYRIDIVSKLKKWYRYSSSVRWIHLAFVKMRTGSMQLKT